MNTETQNETIAQKAYRLLSPIPAEQWCVRQYTDEVGACCAIGHWTRLQSHDPTDYSDDNCYENGTSSIRAASELYLKNKYGYEDIDIADVNNNPVHNGYTEPVIKDRVIHLLIDMIAAGY